MPRQLINIEGVDRSFGPVDVLLDINLLVQDGDRIGIVGHNGAGKTTLLNTISEQSQDVGEIEYAPGIRIAYLTQIRDIESDSTIEEELGRKGRQFQELEEEIASIESQMADPAFYEGDWESVMERYSELQQTLGASGGGNVASIAKATLARLGLDKHPMDMEVNKLSGGEKAKLALARQLVGLAGVDVMFLDEPTNHLDIETTEWLEGFLKDFKGAQLIVSHDRYFLDQVCTRIVEVDNLRAWPWKGNYSQFLRQKIATEAALGDMIHTVEKKIAATTGALKQMKRANKYDKSISAKQKMIERMQQELKALRARVPKKRKPLILTLEATDKASMDVLQLDGATKIYEGLERPILKNQDLEVRKGDRIGIVGGNGQGKTTLLKLINGDEKLTSGIRDLAPGCEIGYFHQDHATLDFNLSPVEQIQKLRPDFQYGDIRAALGRFQFSGNQVTTKLSQLSGGERARVALLKLLLEENNLLLMDEPTNHLDMDSKDTLEEALKGYEGSLITVSHDRWFLDQVVNRIWELQDGVVTVYYGNYTDYIRAKKGLPPLAEGEVSQI
ncbi:ATP-binding cassette domain-containing protein [Candidatus Poseidoniaceae archaeon]|nr:ATP-binding cassette domain-containing protein [Euryarchaeota archaeon]MDA9166533.1 ATP-binding cassette domain-containing protein [Candidatus Poseidoniaceae archaeon]MDA8843664.1 ATP-binding cassette domain-containing protein [Euryarchaeota archaeon]MDA9829425.1 ATP-binding cassette domain-containing protein [Candidatus Poseidoniaceae archaeon]MDC0656076.1 ATP-binding cassette domain-containing protein [Candidatus Poseidoniaceae archaeon]